MTNEAFSRVKIDAQLRDQGWAVGNPAAIRYEYMLPDGTKAEYILNDRHGRAMAVLEELSIPVPPAALQASFVQRANALLSITVGQAHATVRADNAFQSLLAGVFGEGR